MVVPTLRTTIVAEVEALARVQPPAECVVAVIVVMAVMRVVMKSPATRTKYIEWCIATAREGAAMPRAPGVALLTPHLVHHPFGHRHSHLAAGQGPHSGALPGSAAEHCPASWSCHHSDPFDYRRFDQVCFPCSWGSYLSFARANAGVPSLRPVPQLK